MFINALLGKFKLTLSGYQEAGQNSIFLQLRAHFCPCFSCHEQAERVHELNEEIGKLLARAEQLGGEGNVDEAQQLLEMVEKTRGLKKEAEVRNLITALL